MIATETAMEARVAATVAERVTEMVHHAETEHLPPIELAQMVLDLSQAYASLHGAVVDLGPAAAAGATAREAVLGRIAQLLPALDSPARESTAEAIRRLAEAASLLHPALAA